MSNSLQDKISIRLPVKISFKVLDEALRNKLVGENIETEGKDGEVSTYATILDAALMKSEKEGYDLALDIKFKTLTSLFKNKEGRIFLHLAIEFDPEEQEIMVKDYKLEGKSNNWLMDKSLQAVANTFIYEKLKKRMKLDFSPHIEKQLREINQKLEEHIKPSEEISLSGYLENFRIVDVIPGESLFLISIEIEGFAIAELTKIPADKM
ncbi:MAG: DUF4403 family protein [Salegentibacter sp.]|uniref:DUF4403 family protein n=1 Tax=Salegentibacter flavus TaxID=287099 RepID=A0A1I5AS18_9FLAO|nr:MULTISPECIES: DUF4403 family protein [Salegentibacter]MDR9456676.1 DUF4403 family protein [Salegentibacter sp.]SFN65172.1 protein of unknown function [Salegentibacter flavus]